VCALQQGCEDKYSEVLSGFLHAYRHIIKFYGPETLEDAIQKMKYCYEESKHKIEFCTDLKVKGKPKYVGKWERFVGYQSRGRNARVSIPTKGKFYQKSTTSNIG